MSEERETDFLLDDLNKLRDLYEEHLAASEEYEAKKGGMSEANQEFALEGLTAKARAIEAFEANHPKAAAAFWGEHD